MPKVLKIEHADGSGIFVDDRNWLWDLPSHLNYRVSNQMPTPDDEELEFEYGRHVCGFASMKQLRRWFPITVLQHMAKYDMVVTVYHVHRDDYNRGKFQCVFERRLAEPVAKISLSDFILKLKSPKEQDHD